MFAATNIPYHGYLNCLWPRALPRPCQGVFSSTSWGMFFFRWGAMLLDDPYSRFTQTNADWKQNCQIWLRMSALRNCRRADRSDTYADNITAYADTITCRADSYSQISFFQLWAGLKLIHFFIIFFLILHVKISYFIINLVTNGWPSNFLHCELTVSACYLHIHIPDCLQ